MLVPLLAMPIRHPLGNMLVQGWIMTVAALAAPFVMARFLVGRDGAWMAIGACTNTLFLLSATPAVQFDWLVTQPYALSISLGFAALLVADGDYRRGRSVAALVLLLFACWVNIGIVVPLVIAAVLRGNQTGAPARTSGCRGVACVAGRHLRGIGTHRDGAGSAGQVAERMVATAGRHIGCVRTPAHRDRRRGRNGRGTRLAMVDRRVASLENGSCAARDGRRHMARRWGLRCGSA